MRILSFFSAMGANTNADLPSLREKLPRQNPELLAMHLCSHGENSRFCNQKYAQKMGFQGELRTITMIAYTISLDFISLTQLERRINSRQFRS